MLRDTGKTPSDLHRKLASAYLPSQPRIVELMQSNYERRRNAAKANHEFDETFDCGRFGGFYMAMSMSQDISERPADFSFNRQEVFCDVVYFHGLMDFEDVVRCYEITQVEGRDLALNLTSGLFGDALLGYMKREDLVDREDEMAVKWATQIVKELEGGVPAIAAGYMLHAALELRKFHPTPLLTKFARAMITIRLSAVLLCTTGTSKARNLYTYVITHNIREEHFFMTSVPNHALLSSFRFIGNDQANFAYINSGDGISKHPRKLLLAAQHTETTPPKNVESIERYIPFAIYNARPTSGVVRREGRADSIDELYFNATPDNATTTYKDWQYIDDQKAGTCYAMVLWYLPYWLEQEDQFKIEELKLGLQLRLLRAALNDFEATLKLVDEAVMDEEKKEKLLELDKMFHLKRIFISFGWNEALQTIRRLQLKGFDMTGIMNDYRNMWNEYQGKEFWRFIEPNVMGMYISAHNLILKDVEPLQGLEPMRLLGSKQLALRTLSNARRDNAPFEFTKTVIAVLLGEAGRMEEVQGKIIEGAKALELKDYHKALIFGAAIRTRHTSFLKRLYEEGIFATIGSVSGDKGLIDYGELAEVATDEELREAVIQHRGEYEQLRDLIELFKSVEEKEGEIIKVEASAPKAPSTTVAPTTSSHSDYTASESVSSSSSSGTSSTTSSSRSDYKVSEPVQDPCSKYSAQLAHALPDRKDTLSSLPSPCMADAQILGSLEERDMPLIPSRTFEGITPLAFATLKYPHLLLPEQFANLPDATVGIIKPEDMPGMRDDILSKCSAQKLQALSKETWSSLTLPQQFAIPPQVLKELPTDRLNALHADVLSRLAREKSVGGQVIPSSFVILVSLCLSLFVSLAI